MRSLLVFLNLVIITHLSDGAPVPDARVRDVTESANAITCTIFGVRVVDSTSALFTLSNGGGVPSGLEQQSREVVGKLLTDCLNSLATNARFANGGEGGGPGFGAGGEGGGSGGGFDDGGNGNGNPAAYSATGFRGSPSSSYPSTFNTNTASGNPSSDYPSSFNSNSNSVSSTSGNNPANGVNDPNVQYAGFPPHVYSDSGPDTGSSSGDSSVSDTNSRYPTANVSPPATGASYSAFSTNGSPSGSSSNADFFGNGGRAPESPNGSPSNLGRRPQNINAAPPTSNCVSETGCANIEAAGPPGSVQAAPILESQNLANTGASVPVVREGNNRGCPNGDGVDVCADGVSTSR